MDVDPVNFPDEQGHNLTLLGVMILVANTFSWDGVASLMPIWF